MFTEDQLLPIAALQHLIFCERQCALIHVERLWAENRWTVEENCSTKKYISRNTKPSMVFELREACGSSRTGWDWSARQMWWSFIPIESSL